jgi:hypothetical protein
VKRLNVQAKLAKLKKRAKQLCEEMDKLEYPIEQRKKGASTKDYYLTMQHLDVLAEIETLEKTLEPLEEDTQLQRIEHHLKQLRK